METELQKKIKTAEKENQALNQKYEELKKSEDQKEMETKALLTQTLESLEKYKNMDQMKADQYQETSVAEQKAEENLSKDEQIIKTLDNELTESMKRS